MDAAVALGVPAWAVLAVPLAVAALIDLRERRLPNALAAVIACAAAALSYLTAGWQTLLVHALMALAVCGALFGFELGWRQANHEAGLGMGDLKALFSLMLLDPWGGLFTFAFSLFAMAVSGVIMGRRALPLLPFIFIVWMVMGAMG